MNTDIDYVAELCLAKRSAEVIEAVSLSPDLLQSRTQFGDSLLELAVATGNLELVSTFLLAGGDSTGGKPPSDTKNPPLIMAIELESQNRMEMVRLLIQHGADVNTPGSTVKSALHAAVAISSKEIVELLLKNGADINIHLDVDECTPLWCASLWGREDMVRLLLEHGADHQLRNITTSTAPLDEVIRNGNITILSILLNAGANPNSRVLGRETPPINAILHSTPNALEIMNLLLKHGADVNAPGEHVASPLHAAVLVGAIEFVDFLLRHGAEVNKKSPLDELTPIKIAITRGDKAIEDLLLVYGAEHEMARSRKSGGRR